MSGRKRLIKLKPQAITDIKGILKYTTITWGAQQRTRYKKLLEQCLDKIAANPLHGKQVRYGDSRYYRYHVGRKGRHYVFYTVTEETVEVVRILHDSMDFERHFPDDES